ncbi:MAG TPA: hypothetical protein VMS17_27120 [Gemmataceae bacterium]|nr:hypothetical protein [Gemmataceae bacterium]
MTQPPGRPFRAVYSGIHRQKIRTYAARAAVRGIGPAYRAAVKAMHDHLETDPQEWGDPHNRLPHSGLILYHGVQSLLHVFYAVDPVRRLVFVRDILPMPRHGLDDA